MAKLMRFKDIKAMESAVFVLVYGTTSPILCKKRGRIYEVKSITSDTVETGQELREQIDPETLVQLVDIHSVRAS